MDLSRLLSQAVMLTVCVAVVTGFLLVVAFGLARLAVHYLDHFDHEIRRNQAAGSVAQHTVWSAHPVYGNVTDVSPDSAPPPQLQLSSSS